VVGQQINKLTCKIDPVVGKQMFWSQTAAYETIEDVDDVLATKPMAHLDRKAFPTEHIKDGHCAEFFAVAPLVMVKARPHASIGLWARQRASRRTTIFRRRGRFLRKDRPSSR
jgi:hypothetical protein